MIALSGNHDVGFLDFLAAPTADGLFAHNGGEMTARSYGVDLDFSTRSGLMAGPPLLQAAVPERHLGFLRGLAAAVSFGDYFFCHAGVQPGRPLAEQSPDDLMWIRWRFLAHEGLYEKIIVHGHTPTAEVEFRPIASCPGHRRVPHRPAVGTGHRRRRAARPDGQRKKVSGRA